VVRRPKATEPTASFVCVLGPRGQTPTLQYNFNWDKMSAVASLTFYERSSEDLVARSILFLDLAVVRCLRGLQGRNLRLPSARASAVVYSQATRATHSAGEANPRFQGVRRAIFSGLVAKPLVGRPPELYDLAFDPARDTIFAFWATLAPRNCPAVWKAGRECSPPEGETKRNWTSPVWSG
jgi:hypothetical protein